MSDQSARKGAGTAVVEPVRRWLTGYRPSGLHPFRRRR